MHTNIEMLIGWQEYVTNFAKSTPMTDSGRQSTLITDLWCREGEVINDRVSLIREDVRHRLAGLLRRVTQPHQVVVDTLAVYVVVHLLGLPLHRQVKQLLDPFRLKKRAGSNVQLSPVRSILRFFFRRRFSRYMSNDNVRREIMKELLHFVF